MTSTAVSVSPTVQHALDNGSAVVALESTVYSTLGLPVPHNRHVLDASRAVITAGGATPALTAVVDGQAVVGVEDPEPLLTATHKVAARDLAVAKAQRWDVGVTTVGASLTLAHQAGIQVFATGGIGGVHRNAAVTGDIFGTDELPAFTTTSSGLPVPHRIDNPAEIADVLRHRQALGQGGVLVCVPPPEPLDPALLDHATVEAQSRADAQGVMGPKRTPFILGAIADITAGASVGANTALVENNARVATQIAVALASS